MRVAGLNIDWIKMRAAIGILAMVLCGMGVTQTKSEPKAKGAQNSKAQPGGQSEPASAASSATPKPTLTDLPAPPPPPLSASVARSLLVQFRRAQQNEISATRHHLQFELKELKQAQSAKEKEWAEKERKERRKFFEENKKGPERRKYIGEHLERRKKFERELSDARKTKKADIDARLDELKKNQAENLKKFEEAINRKERPDTALWPK